MTVCVAFGCVRNPVRNLVRNLLTKSPWPWALSHLWKVSSSHCNCAACSRFPGCPCCSSTRVGLLHCCCCFGYVLAASRGSGLDVDILHCASRCCCLNCPNTAPPRTGVSPCTCACTVTYVTTKVACRYVNTRLLTGQGTVVVRV